MERKQTLKRTLLTIVVENDEKATHGVTMSAAPHRWSFVFDEPTRILVVDDDPIQREFASVYLSAPLCTVDTVGDASAALDLLAREHFDIVLADIEMPGMNGIEMVKEMRANERLRTVPIIMATCHEDIVSIDQAYTAGATSFTTKPINWRQFSYQIRYVIRASRAQSTEQAVQVSGASDSGGSSDIAASLSAIVDCAKRIASERGLDADLQTIIDSAESSLKLLRLHQGAAETPARRSVPLQSVAKQQIAQAAGGRR